jgi:hypothetical protein
LPTGNAPRATVRAVGFPVVPSMPPKERPMPPANQVSASDKRREIHRAQLNLVQASLRAGVQYQRPGRVAKAPAKRS